MSELSKQAFPVGWGSGPGMTMREWFAGMALAGLCGVRLDEEPSHLATRAVEMADRVLRELEKA